MLLPGPAGQIVASLGHLGEAEAVCPFQDRHDEALCHGNGNSNIDLPPWKNPVPLDPGIQPGIPLQSSHGGLNDEGQEGQRAAPTLYEDGLLPLPELCDGRHVHFDDRGGMGRGLLAPHHVLGDGAAHRSEGNDLLVGLWSDDRFPLLKIGQDIPLGQPAFPTRPWDLLKLRRVQSVPPREFEDGRRIPTSRFLRDRHNRRMGYR